MSKEKFKKGEWYLQEYTDAYTNIVRCNAGKGFETVYIASTSQSRGEEQRANARLMAAAPDMYDALKMSLQMLEQTLSYREQNELTAGNIFLTSTIDEIKRAIKKAIEDVEVKQAV